MKKNVKGFMLIETLVVSTIVTTVLVFLYVQFNNIVKNFNRELHYNSVNNLYILEGVKNYIINDESFFSSLKTNLLTKIINDDVYYIQIVKDGAVQMTFDTTFEDLIEFYKIKNMIFTVNPINLTKADYKKIANPNFENFIKYIDKGKKEKDDDQNVFINDYRFFVELEDNQFASLKISN